MFICAIDTAVVSESPKMAIEAATRKVPAPPSRFQPDAAESYRKKGET
jgi:hypothetical protein